MKIRTVIPVITVTAAAAGFFAGRLTAPAPETGPKPLRAAPVAVSGVLPAADSAQADAKRNDVITITVPRPFAPGQAEAWVSRMIDRLMNRVQDEMDPLDMARELAVMDAASLKEAAEIWMVQRRKIPDVGDPDDRGMVDWMNGVLYLEWAKRDAAGVLAHLRDLPPEFRDGKRTAAVFKALAKSNEGAARAAVQGLTGGERQAALEGMIEGLASSDPVRALEFAVETRDAMAGDRAGEAVMRLAKTDPASAADWTARIAAAGGGTVALVAVAREWSDKDAAAAEAWARTYQGAGKEDFLARVLQESVKTDAARIAEEIPALAKGSPDSQSVGHLADEVAKKMLDSRTPPEVAAWAETLPEGPIRRGARAGLAKGWAGTDAAAASEWIDRLPPGEERDACAEPLIDRLRETDPAAAFEWAKSLTAGSEAKATLRHNQLQHILQKWEIRDPEAAQAGRDFLKSEEQAGR